MLLAMGLLLSGVFAVYRHFFPTKKQATSSTTTTVGSGGTANITNINNPLADLKQGIYWRLASDRGSIGVFKEVMSNIDVSVGAGKDWQDGKEFIEVETRYKF